MDCWEVLGIEPDSDKKTIKIAYAKLLKKHRPDEDPEGFQRLHKAYKHALQWVPIEYIDNETPWMTDEGKPTFKEEPEITDSEMLSVDMTKASEVTLQAQEYSEDDNWLEESPAPELSAEEKILIAEIDSQEESFGKDWDTLYQRVNQIIKSPKLTNTVESWRFIESLPSMHDLEFRKATADKIFEVVAEVNHASLANKNLYVQRPVINYLNGLFSWDKKWQEYEYEYSREMLDAVFPYLEEADRPAKNGSQKRELFYYHRILAFAIDLLILVVVGYFIDSIATNWGAEDSFTAVFYWVLFYVALVIPLQESSRYQGTVGKRIVGLEVITGRGDRLNFFHALARSIVTAFCCAAFKIVLWINMFLSWRRSELLQDTMTRSYVRLKLGR